MTIGVVLVASFVAWTDAGPSHVSGAILGVLLIDRQVAKRQASALGCGIGLLGRPASASGPLCHGEGPTDEAPAPPEGANDG